MHHQTEINLEISSKTESLRKIGMTTEPQIGISIVVPARNEEEHIAKGLNKLLTICNAAQFPTEIHVVDNNSDDHTVTIVRKFPVNLWSCSGASPAEVRNYGASHANYSILAFTDGDCVVCDNWLDNIFQALSGQGAGAFGGPHIAPFKENNWFVKIWNPNQLKPFEKENAKLPGSNFAITAPLFRKLGGFDESLVSAEDDDLSLRVIKGSYRSVSNSDHFVEHWGYPKSLFQIFKRQIWHGSTQLKAHGPIRDKVLLLTQIWLATLLATPACIYFNNLIATLTCLATICAIPILFTANHVKYSDHPIKQTIFALPCGLAYTTGRAVGLCQELFNMFSTRLQKK